MTDEELFEQARAVNFGYKEAVAGVQLEILDADWQTSAYGDSPWECPGDASGYEFDLTRRTPEGWRLGGAPMELAEEVSAWLNENGWTDIKTRGYSGEIADVVVEAEYPEKHVDLLVVDISPGEVFDSVTISATSTCEPGDAHTISTMRRPGDGEREKLPASEHPTAPPSFGHTEDGKRRFWKDSE
ncbi:hypothetical protein ACIQTT_08670 [Microbacterium sp. NPDC090225]|uniref:hypothetical protein n=1 Tax=Microbacterium sp. NPDC090225 TaxID=3364207 RepID=UPI003826D8C0